MPLWLIGIIGVGAYLLLAKSGSASSSGSPSPYGGGPAATPPGASPATPATPPPYTLPADTGQPGGYATQAEAQAALDASGGGTAVQLSDGRWYGMPYGGYG